jgi:hypothetical protein
MLGDAKSAAGINRQLEIALVMVRQLIVFHCQNRGHGEQAAGGAPFKITSAQNDFSLG